MTDRELLELAAKTDGIDADDIDYEWNPLIDDGDALRLKLERVWNEQQKYYRTSCQR